MEQKIDVGNIGADQRLDKFLLVKFPRYSRAFLKEQIKQGNFLVNGKKIKPSYILKPNDKISLAPEFELPENTTIIPDPKIKLSIVYEDENVIIIDKPAGLSVHPRQTKNGAPVAEEIDNTLASGLLAHYPPLASVGDCPEIRPGIVHRLDKNTSGLMVVAKNQQSFEWLKEQFKEKKVQKKYLALVNGQVKNETGLIKSPIGRASGDPTRQKISADGKTAVTEYRVAKRFRNFTLLEVYPKTGRMHQIRIHLASVGHPVAGDKKYGPRNLPCPSGLNRQFLHAQELSIALPVGQINLFTSPLPADLKIVLKELT